MSSQSRFKIVQASTAIATIAVTVISATTSFYFSVDKPFLDITVTQTALKEQVELTERIKEEYVASKDYIIQANKIAEELKNSTANTSIENALKTKSLEKKVEQLNLSLDNLYSAINSNPEKALSIPMINKEIKSLDEKIKENAANFERQMDRTYQMFMWVCGTLALGLLGLIITVVITFKAKE